MARIAKRATPDGDSDDVSRAQNRTARNTARRALSSESSSPVSGASFSSDKENRGSSSRQRHDTNGKSMLPPRLPSLGRTETAPSTNKRRKLGERGNMNTTQPASRLNSEELEAEELEDTEFYDPDQSMAERRAVRKGIRDLSRELTDSRAELLASDSTGLYDMLTRANDIFGNVKQTSDATLDSRLLVSAGDLSARRSAQLRSGDTTNGIDLDDFIQKCFAFMRRGPSEAESGLSTQRRRRDDNDDHSNSEPDDDGDACNWEWLGRKACCPNNLRPPVPGFLLGPLSVQKRVRIQTQRRERLRKLDPRDAVRPEELTAKDIEQVENSNLTVLCRKIWDLLQRTQVEGEENFEAMTQANPAMTESERLAAIYQHNLADNGGVCLYRFTFNPKSFGQTVENLFYTSFLIRDGKAGLGTDQNGLPTLHRTNPRNPEEIEEHGALKHQAIFHLDFDTWEDVVQVFGITESIIPHRISDENTRMGTKGWYA